MTDQQAHLDLSKDIGKVAASVEGLIGRIDEMSKYIHQRNHDIIDLITERKVEAMQMEQKLDRLHDDMQGIKHDVASLSKVVTADLQPHIEDYKKMRARGWGIIIAVSTIATVITWTVSNWIHISGRG